jgi:hypothetical protein
MKRFYNPGPPINEMLAYTNTTVDPREANNISQWPLKALEKDFFEVPEVVTISTPEGDVTIPVHFARVLKHQKATQGIILVDTAAKDILDGDNLAASDAEAKKKGDAMYREYLRALCTEWYAIVAETKAAGAIPKAASGLFAYALKKMHLEDPADTIDTIMRAKEGQVANADVQAQLAAQQAQINQLLGALNARKEGK